MSAIDKTSTAPKMICFGIGFIGLAVLALLLFYPAVLVLFFGSDFEGSVGTSQWSLPVLITALIMSSWFMVGFLALLQPGLLVAILPKLLTKGLVSTNGSMPKSAHQQFIHGRTFVKGTIAAKIVVWPAVIFSCVLVLPYLLGFAGWSTLAAFILGGLLMAGFLTGLLLPNVLAMIIRQFTPETSKITASSAWPFIGGIVGAVFLMIFLGSSGRLPNMLLTHLTKNYVPSTKTMTSNDTQAGSDIGDNTPQANNHHIEDAKHYLTWKDDEFAEIKSAYCVGGVSVLLPKDKNFIGGSLDPDSVTYDPYARNVDFAQQGSTMTGQGQVYQNPNGDVEIGPDTDKAASASSGSEVSARMADEATANGNVQPVNPNWLRDLGAPWGLGSVQYSGEDKITGFDFPTGSHVFVTKAFTIKPNGSETETEALLVPTGCDDEIVVGIPIRRQLLSQMEGVAHLTVKTRIGIDGMTIRNIVTDIPLLNLEHSNSLIQELNGVIRKQGYQPNDGTPPILMVARWSQEEETENRKIEEAKIRRAIAARQRANVTWIAAGQLIPLCNASSAPCVALNHATTIYIPKGN